MCYAVADYIAARCLTDYIANLSEIDILAHACI